MDDSYRDIEFELYGNLVQIRSILAYYDTQDTILEEIDKSIRQIKSKTYNVAVMGEFRRGKSSLINALLGLEVLPSDVTPTTATINRITFGAEPEVIVHYKDGRRQSVDISQLQEYVTKLTEENERTALTIREAVIYYPTVICQNHVDIIDTPGLNDDESMTRTTIDMLSGIDAVIVVVSALSPYSETEKNFVAQLIGTSGIRDILFVVTFIDQIDEDEYPRLFEAIKSRICTMTRQTLAERFANEPEILHKGDALLDEGSLKIFGVSAKQALRSFAGNDRRLLQKSRFVEFKEELYKILTAQQSNHIVEKTASLIGISAARFDDIYKGKFEHITSRIDELQTSIGQTGRYFLEEGEQLGGYRQEYAAALARLTGRTAQICSDIMGLFIGALTAVRVNMAEAIRSAIEAGRELAENYAQDLCQKDMTVLDDLFLSLGRKMSQRRSDMLLRYVEADSAIRPAAPESFLEKYEGQLRDLRKPCMVFEASFIPQCVNLAHYNSITHIYKTVVPAVEAYIANLAGSAESRWSLCSAYLAFDDELKEPLREYQLRALSGSETDMQVCRSNYQMHKVMVESLVKRTEELRERFTHRG